MDNAKILSALDEFAKAKPKDIPKELDDYLRCVAACGDPIYQWSLVKCLFRQKLLNVISEFYESCPMMDVPISPNVDAFNYEIIKSRLLRRYDTFTGAPFTIQRIAELLTTPRKQYNRVDKYMRAIEKNIWVVSTREPGRRDTPSNNDTNLVNGMFSNVIQANNGKSNQERLKRQSELFDEDEEDDEDEEQDLSTVDVQSMGPQHSSDETSEPSGTLPDTPDSPAADGAIEDSGKSSEEEADAQEQAPAAVNDSPSTESEDSSDVSAPLANNQSPENNVQSTEEIESSLEETLPASHELPEEAKINSVVVTELTDSEEKVDKEPDAALSDDSEHILEEPSNSEDDPVVPSTIHLKRKLDNADSEEDIPSKKVETEEPSSSSFVEQSMESPVVTESEEVIFSGATEPEDKKIEAMTDATDVVVTENKGADIDEKVEMIVEETEQAMEVDETDVAVQSPMVQEDIAEPMEESDICNS